MRYINLIKNIKNWWLYLAIKFGLARPDPILFQTRSGVVVEVPRRLLQTFKEVFMDECYADPVQSVIPDRPTVFDVGANAGFFTLFSVSRFSRPRVFSFEPIPVNFEQLEKNRRLNPDADIATFQNAVAGANGTLELTFNPEDSFTTSASSTRPQAGASISVDCFTLDDVFRNNDLERCDFLKMDCEGSEFDIFYHCSDETLARITQIAMEVHPDDEPGHDMQSLETFFHSKGFKTHRRPVDMLWAWREN